MKLLANEAKSGISLIGLKQKDEKYYVKRKKEVYAIKVKGSLPMFHTGFSYLNLELYDVKDDRVTQTTNNSHKGGSVTAVLEVDKGIDCEKEYILRVTFTYEEKNQVVHNEEKDYYIVFTEK